jgi:hypothetical protein
MTKRSGARMGRLSKRKEAELRLIADLTWEAILAAHEKVLRLQAKQTTRTAA